MAEATTTTTTNKTTNKTIDSALTMTDVSGIPNIQELKEAWPTKKWIKLIPVEKSTPIDGYVHREHFQLIGSIVLDTDIAEEGKKKGEKARNTVIKLQPVLPEADYKKKTEWLYLFTVNGHIVKIGGTRDGIKGRWGSYLCGHHIGERGKSRDCSKTNGFIYNTFEFYLHQGCTIEMHGYQLPRTEIVSEILGIPTVIVAQTYHAYESRFMESFKAIYGHYPFLSDNGDPEYR
jgi:hypothetical protein